MVKISPRKEGFGNITESELRFIQSNLLDLVLEFDALCKKHNITYYLDGGSALGALRHGGFIPWDDDIDLLIKKSEFDKLLDIIDSEIEDKPNRIFAYMKRQQSSHRSFARYINTDIPHILPSGVVEANYPPGIFIDIFILDPVPAGKLESYTKDLEEAEEWFHKRLTPATGKMPYAKYRLLDLVEHFGREDKIFDYFDKKLSRYNDADAAYYIPRNGFNYGIYDADVFQKPKYVKFEGHLLPAPTMPEKFVRTHYSIDWFLLPPAEKRYSHHLTLTSKDFSLTAFLNQFNWLPVVQKIYQVQYKKHKYQVLRHKSNIRVDKYHAKLNALLDNADIEKTLSTLSINKLKKLFDNKKYDQIIASFDFYINKQLRDEYKKFSIKLNLPYDYLNILILSFVHTGRFYDAERILKTYSREDPKLQEIRELIEHEKEKEIFNQDDPKQSKPILKNVPAVPDELDIPIAKNELLDHGITLLTEIDRICRDNEIKYTIGGNLLVDSVVNQEITGDYTQIDIYMQESDFRKFMSLENKLPDDRKLESIYTNSYFVDESVRYVDTTTTYYKATSPWIKYPGVHVSIRPMVGRGKFISKALKIDSFVMRALYTLPSAILWMRLGYTWIHTFLIKRVLENNQPFNINEAIPRKPNHKAPYGGTGPENTEDYTSLRKKSVARISLRAKSYIDVEFNGQRFMALESLSNSVLNEMPWLQLTHLSDTFNKRGVIYNLNTPYDEVFGNKSQGLPLTYSYSRSRFHSLTKKMEKIDKDKLSHKKILITVAYEFYRYKMHIQYTPLLPKLASLLQDGNFKALEELLQDYTDHFNYFFQRGYIFAFDPGVFAIYIELLRYKYSDGLARYVSLHVSPVDYEFNKELEEKI